ncbi:MAG TPA: hypothetical protein DDZ04_00305 [Parabacteroides sp.]|nr:hypothetical protein [Parabacteroides sp.]
MNETPASVAKDGCGRFYRMIHPFARLGQALFSLGAQGDEHDRLDLFHPFSPHDRPMGRVDGMQLAVWQQTFPPFSVAEDPFMGFPDNGRFYPFIWSNPSP